MSEVNENNFSVTYNYYETVKSEDINRDIFATGVGSEENYNKLGQYHAKQLMDGFNKRSKRKLNMIVEYGIGDTRVGKYIATECKNFIGIDVSQVILDEAKNKLYNYNMNNIDNYELFLNINFNKNNIADFVYSLQVLQHNIYEEQIKIINHIKTILKPNAIACIHFPKIEDKPWYKNSNMCMCFTKEQVEEYGKMFNNYDIEEIEFCKNWMDYYLWVKK